MIKIPAVFLIKRGGGENRSKKRKSQFWVWGGFDREKKVVVVYDCMVFGGGKRMNEWMGSVGVRE